MKFLAAAGILHTIFFGLAAYKHFQAGANGQPFPATQSSMAYQAGVEFSASTNEATQ